MTWRAAWDRFIPFLEFAPALRMVIYTANAIESLDYQLCKITKNLCHFTNDTAVVKLRWLSLRTIKDKRARQRVKAANKTEASACPRLIEGSSTHGWNEALGALLIAYPQQLTGQTNLERNANFVEILTSSPPPPMHPHYEASRMRRSRSATSFSPRLGSG